MWKIRAVVHSVHFRGRDEGFHFRVRFCDFRADLGVQEIGDGDRGQDTDDGDYNKEFDKGKCVRVVNLFHRFAPAR